MIELNYRDARPIYEQIKDGIRRLVMLGAVQPDEKLPSVRELASSLAINPNTIQRAYRELEKEGYLYTVSGRGSFAAPVQEIAEGRKQELYHQFEGAAQELLYLGEGPEKLKQKIDKLFEKAKQESIGKGGDGHDTDGKCCKKV